MTPSLRLRQSGWTADFRPLFGTLLACVLTAGLVMTSGTGLAVAAEGDRMAGQMRSLLAAHCLDCHSADYAEAGFRVDEVIGDDDNRTAAFDFSDARRFAQLEKIYDRLSTGEMPPQDAEQPSQTIREAASQWLGHRLHASDERRQQSQGRTRRRRLTRTEYEHAVHDLLAIETPLGGMLPGDAVAHGFDKTADALGLSPVLIGQYLKAADAAVAAAIVLEPQPPETTERYSLLEDAELPKQKDGVLNQGRLFKKLPDAMAIFASGRYCPSDLRQMRTRYAGRYEITIDAYAYRNDGAIDQAVGYQLFGGQLLQKDGIKRSLGFFEALPAEEAKPLVITVDLPENSLLKLVPWDTGHRIYQEGAGESTEDAVALRSVTVRGPLYDQWPPASHRVVFGDLPVRVTNQEAIAKRPRTRPEREVITETPLEDASRLLTAFARRAFRRDVTADDVQPFVDLVAARLEAGETFTTALPLGFEAILCDPMFLTVGCDAGQPDLSPPALASRLSLFLWGSLPDDELRSLAASGRIAEPEVLRQQVRRMLADDRRERFIGDLANQWLDLAWIDASTPDPELFPEYDDLLRESMVTETLMTLRYLFDENRPAREIADADYAFLDARLARHYGLDDRVSLDGFDFQRVDLPPGSLRGGFLTQAAIAKVTANGTHTSPVYRGSWVLDAILGQPAPPPPPNVPAVEPDVRGATTIREKLAKHREDAACAVCHDRLDPAGFAMESLDVIGRERSAYRVPKGAGGQYITDTIGNRNIHYFENPENRVDASGRLPDGREFDDLRGFKRLIAQNDRQLARALVAKLIVYGTGEGLSFCDRAAVEEICDAAEADNYGLQTLLVETIAHSIFRRR